MGLSEGDRFFVKSRDGTDSGYTKLGLQERVDQVMRQIRKGTSVILFMEKSAFGLSSGLEYGPGCLVTNDELIELATVVGRYNGLYTSLIPSPPRGVSLMIGIDNCKSFPFLRESYRDKDKREVSKEDRTKKAI